MRRRSATGGAAAAAGDEGRNPAGGAACGGARQKDRCAGRRARCLKCFLETGIRNLAVVVIAPPEHHRRVAGPTAKTSCVAAGEVSAIVHAEAAKKFRATNGRADAKAAVSKRKRDASAGGDAGGMLRTPKISDADFQK